jgi:sirohydrochlorin ferrochelatase
MVVVAHGTVAARGLATVEAVVDRLREARPGVAARLCYVDVARPRLGDVLATLDGAAVVVPLLLSSGYHVRRDIPAALAAHPRVPAVLARPLGPDPLLAEALADRLRQAGWDGGGPVVLATAGSREPAAAADVETMAGLLASLLAVPVLPASAHDVPALVRRLSPRPAVASYLVADGQFARRVAAAGALTAAPVGAHPALVQLVLQRYDEAALVPR